MKSCKVCLNDKEFSEFHKDKTSKDGLVPACKSCRSHAQFVKPKSRKRYYKLDELNNLIERECTDCRVVKSAEMFSKHSACPGGKYTVCKLCKSIQDQTYRDENIDKVKEIQQKYYIENSDRLIKKAREWDKLNPDKVSKHDRRVDYKLPIHKFDRSNVLELKNYIRSVNKENQDNIDKFTLDHIIPINSDDVCGLHVSWNLQILSWSENAVKSNKFDGTYHNESWKEKYYQFIKFKEETDGKKN